MTAINYDILVKHFTGDFQAVAENVLLRIDEVNEGTIDDDLWQAMNDELIYTEDQWSMIAYYCTPQNADFNSAWDDFYADLRNAISDGVLEA